MPKSKKSSAREIARTSNGSVPTSDQSSRPSKKRLRAVSSSEEELEISDDEQPGTSGGRSRTQVKSKEKNRTSRVSGELSSTHRGERSKIGEVEVRKLKQKLRKAEADRRKLEEKLSSKRSHLTLEREKTSVADRKIEKMKKDSAKIKKSNEKLVRDREEAEKEIKDDNSKLKKKVESLKQKLAGVELQRVKLESKISSLSLSDSGAGSSASGSNGGKGPPGGLFQDMMDNFKELAENQLQCAVCSELFVEATSINCGHSFCSYCIREWKKKKANCPVCRTDIKQIVACKVLDDYTDKLYEQFVSEGGKLQRQALKDEREKIKKEAEAANQARIQERRERGHARTGGGMEMVNIVLNRARRSGNDDDSSIDSDDTVELHLSDGGGAVSDTDTSSPSEREDGFNRPRSTFDDTTFLSDTDSSDISFHEVDTDSLSDLSDTDQSSPDSTSSDDSD